MAHEPLTRPRAVRRASGLLAACVAVGLLAACSSSSASSSAASGGSATTGSATSAASGSATTGSTGSSTGKITVAFNMGAEADPFFIAMNIGAATEAKALGVTLIWQGDPSVYSPSTQIPILDQLLAEHPSALIIAPTDPSALQPGVNEALGQGIPVVNVDTHVNDLSKVLSFITGNNQQGGAAAADAMAKAMGYKSGQTYQVVVGQDHHRLQHGGRGRPLLHRHEHRRGSRGEGPGR